MQAGKLRFKVDVEQYDGTTWQPYFSDYFDIQTVSEGESQRGYQLLGRWRPEWDQVAGLSNLSEGYRIVWSYGQKDGQALVRLLMIRSVLDPDNRRREVQLACEEIGENT